MIFKIKRENFKLSFIIPNSFLTALIPFLSKIPNRIGFATDLRTFMLTKSLKKPDKPLHQTLEYAKLLQLIDVTYDDKIFSDRITLNFNLDTKEKINKILDIVGESFVVLAPGAKYGSSKQWIPHYFSIIGDYVFEKYNKNVLIIGSNSDLKTSWWVKSCMRNKVFDFTGKLSISESLLLLKKASLLIANDSGALHLGSLAGIPVIGIYGPTTPERAHPIWKPYKIVKLNVECSPCNYRICPYDHKCMMKLKPDLIIESVDQYLKF